MPSPTYPSNAQCWFEIICATIALNDLPFFNPSLYLHDRLTVSKLECACVFPFFQLTHIINYHLHLQKKSKTKKKNKLSVNDDQNKSISFSLNVFKWLWGSWQISISKNRMLYLNCMFPNSFPFISLDSCLVFDCLHFFSIRFVFVFE